MTILVGDVLEQLATLAPGSVQTCVTSPPYWSLRSYLAADHPDKGKEIGTEKTPAEYVQKLVTVFRAVRRVLREDGTVFLNLGDCFLDKQLLGMPWKVAFALQDDGWILRQGITWCKTAPMPESVQGSHFTRHRVTIAEYESLLSLRDSTGRNVISAEQSAMPRVSERESASIPTERSVPAGETTLCDERQGESHDASTRGASRGSRGATACQPVSTGAGEQEPLRSDGEGAGNSREGAGEIPHVGAWTSEGENQRQSAEVLPGVAGTQEGSGQAVPSIREGASRARKRYQPPTGMEGRDATRGADVLGGLAGDSQGESVPLFLLQDENETNDGPCDPLEQGWSARQEQRGSGLWQLQLQEEQPDPSALVDCPGCPKCERHGGYVFVLSAGRPTSATEMVFLLTKSARYFYDADAVRVPAVSYERQGTSGIQPPKVQALQESGHHGKGGNLSINYERSARNLWNYWLISPQPTKEAHFATMPERLVEPCILAGTSERGCCRACGAPWVRITEVERVPRPTSGPQRGGRGKGWVDAGIHGKGGWVDNPTIKTTQTTGWQPTCAHDGEPVPCTVLDPFLGSGTVGLVAERLGRRWVGIELNEEYATLARKRTAQLGFGSYLAGGAL